MGKVLVAMSGGIDSTVTAIMLREQGYEVVGITMKTWDYESSKVNGKETGCCSLDSINDARAIAVEHGIHHFILDIRDEFGDFVIDNFVDEYLAGRTPNPCVLCNTHIKWEALLKRADKLDCEFIATGHYAQRNFNEENGRHFISRGKDLNKDQSYVLWGLAQKNLARTLFPMGQYHKTEIKQMAVDMGYMDLAKKDPYYILPILAGLSQLVLSKLSLPQTNKLEKIAEKTPDKQDDVMYNMQKQMIYMMPVMTIFIGISLPSGLVLYWFLATLFGLAQQWILNKKLLKN